MASTYLTNTFGTPTNQNIFTLSFWIKRGKAGTDESLFTTDIVTGSVYAQILLNANGTLRWYGTDDAGGNILNLISDRIFVDTAGWYNFCFQFDNTQVTASDRQNIYVNGVKLTDFSTEDYTNSSALYTWNEASRLHFFGAKRHTGTLGGYYNGLMCYAYFVDGSIIAPTEFGSTDATTGEWKINTSPTISSYGNNGFLIMEDGNTITDQSPNSNDWALGGGTLTNTEDCPSDVFCTMNPSIGVSSPSAYSYGNTKVASDATAWQASAGTLGFTKGKFYWEIKGIAEALSMYGVGEASINMNNANPQDLTGTTIFFNDSGGEMRKDGSNTANDYGTFGATDVMGIACNMDDKEISIYKNGSAIVTDYALSPSIVNCIPFNSIYPSGGVGSFNFGNGYFNDVAISSEGTNASGIGKFEHDVPAGYTALSTKGLNS